MKYTILFVIAAFIMSVILLACSSSKNNADNNDPNARKGTPSNIDIDRLSNTWKHVKTKDTYDGIWKEIKEENKVISFSKEGKYTEDKPGNPTCEGDYTVEGDNLKLKHSCNKVELTCKVVFLEKSKLVLSMRGRHGEVFYVYEQKS